MVDRRQVLAFRVRAQQLDRVKGSVTDTAVLDYGVQETGPDGARWALAIRGVDVTKLSGEDIIVLWTLRGAPHYYRRADVAKVAAAVAPFSAADAGKRIFDASKPLRAAGIDNLEALDATAGKMRAIVTKPMTKGEVSTRLTKVMPEPYLRFCRVCDATHLFEQPFRLSALRGGLELQPGTSPPVLQRIKGYKPGEGEPDDRFDVIRGYLRLLGPATPKMVADFIDAPVKEVKQRWPEDTAEIKVGGEVRWLLAADEKKLGSAESGVTRLLGPYDLFMQAKDRGTLVPDQARAKKLWPVIGRPGGVLAGGDLVGMWRPRKSGSKFVVAVEAWKKLAAAERKAITEQAELLAAYRGIELTGVDFDT